MDRPMSIKEAKAMRKSWEASGQGMCSLDRVSRASSARSRLLKAKTILQGNGISRLGLATLKSPGPSPSLYWATSEATQALLVQRIMSEARDMAAQAIADLRRLWVDVPPHLAVLGTWGLGNEEEGEEGEDEEATS